MKKNDKAESLKQTRKLLEDLCDPGKTPRVPSIIRDRARTILRHYPFDIDLDSLAENCH